MLNGIAHTMYGHTRQISQQLEVNLMFKTVIGIAMINKPFWSPSQIVKIEINGKICSGKVCDLPFI